MYYACRMITHVAACQVDVAFVVDCSGSIRKANPPGVDNWQYVTQFIVDVINNINLQQTKVAAVSFGTQLQHCTFMQSPYGINLFYPIVCKTPTI